jgi:hypothetical protein
MALIGGFESVPGSADDEAEVVAREVSAGGLAAP